MNLRPLAPHASALPGCATPRQSERAGLLQNTLCFVKHICNPFGVHSSKARRENIVFLHSISDGLRRKRIFFAATRRMRLVAAASYILTACAVSTYFSRLRAAGGKGRCSANAPFSTIRNIKSASSLAHGASTCAGRFAHWPLDSHRSPDGAHLGPPPTSCWRDSR